MIDHAIESRHLPKEIDGAGPIEGASDGVQTFKERKQHVIKQSEQDELHEDPGSNRRWCAKVGAGSGNGCEKFLGKA